MITIHQATFGDKSGGYALLSSSFDDDSIPKRIGNATDVNDRPAGEVLVGPIVRGFSIDDYYLIIRSFPHVEQGIRSGRVFSHALFIEKNDIEKVSNLKGLLDLLMTEIDLNATTPPIQFDVCPAPCLGSIPVKGRAAYGVKGLLNLGEFSDTLAWVGRKDFFDFMCQIWVGFPKHLRKGIFFGAAFDPRKVKADSLRIVHIDPELAFKWKKSDFLVVEESSEAELRRESEFFLAGDKTRASSLEQMIGDYDLKYDQISDLTVLEKVVATFQKLDSNVALGDLILFADLISKYNQNLLSAANEKKELLLKVTRGIGSATTQEILALRNVNWKGFAIHEETIGNALQDWGKQVVIGGYNRTGISKVIASAFLESKGKESWWHLAIRTGVISGLKNWVADHAKVIWEWIRIEPRLVTFLADIAKQDIPKEDDLLDDLPVFEEPTSLEIIAISKKMNWLQLHGKLLVQILPIEQALHKQLEIDMDPTHFPALRLMAKAASDRDFIQCAVKNGDKRLLEISAELLVINSSLLENLDVQNQQWREIWLSAILKGAKPWTGVSKPQNSLYELLDMLIAGKIIDSKLIDSFATTSLSDLSTFHARREVWNVLPRSSRETYLSATARACVAGFDRGTIPISSIEIPLLGKVADETFFRGFAVDKTIQLASKIALFQHLPNIGPNHLIVVLEHNRFDVIEAENVGGLIRRNSWVYAAKYIFKCASYRKDLLPALAVCFSILDVFDQLQIWLKGYSDVKPNTEAWHEALIEICSEVFDKGPSQNGLWELCGGKNSDLLTNSTGKEAWIHAIKQIKKGKVDVKIGKLMSELIKESPRNEKLKMLEEARPK